LLAQCDSCIGSKSSINFLHFKNQLGTFYAPREVVIVFELLGSLPHEALLSGLGEIIKLHLVDGPQALASLRESLDTTPVSISADGLSETQRATLRRLIVDSLNIKKRFIEIDEFDSGVRNLLNYGHTFGHAYEAATHYVIPHGIAVTLGVATATWFSARLGWIEDKDGAELIQWLRPYFEPYQQALQSVQLDAIFEAMRRDKKNVGQNITCILTRGPGAMEKVTLPAEQVRTLLGEWLAVLSSL
jgi:3-dehydroquinate synthase